MGFKVKEIDLHGHFPDEVEYLLDGCMVECRLQGVTTLNIIHGKGEGALRQAVVSALVKYRRNILKVEKGENTILEGGAGVTRVRLKINENEKKAYNNKVVFLPEKPSQSVEDFEVLKEKRRQAYLKKVKRALKK